MPLERVMYFDRRLQGQAPESSTLSLIICGEHGYCKYEYASWSSPGVVGSNRPVVQVAGISPQALRSEEYGLV